MWQSLFAIFIFVNIDMNRAKQQIHIGALIPRVAQQDRFCFASAIRVAVKQINNSTEILDGYEIVLHIKETFVSVI